MGIWRGKEKEEEAEHQEEEKEGTRGDQENGEVSKVQLLIVSQAKRLISGKPFLTSSPHLPSFLPPCLHRPPPQPSFSLVLLLPFLPPHFQFLTLFFLPSLQTLLLHPFFSTPFLPPPIFLRALPPNILSFLSSFVPPSFTFHPSFPLIFHFRRYYQNILLLLLLLFPSSFFPCSRLLIEIGKIPYRAPPPWHNAILNTICNRYRQDP